VSREWVKQFAARRREIDRLVLREAERAISLEDCPEAPTVKNQQRPPAVKFEDHISFLDEERKRIAAAFGRPVK
jgi:hypothetical protein